MLCGTHLIGTKEKLFDSSFFFQECTLNVLHKTSVLINVFNFF